MKAEKKRWGVIVVPGFQFKVLLAKNFQLVVILVY